MRLLAKVLVWTVVLALTIAMPGPALLLWGVLWIVGRPKRAEKAQRTARLEAEAAELQGRVDGLRQRFQIITGGGRE